MRYVVINAYSVRNAGDAAIMLATEELFSRTAGAETAISTRHHAEDKEFYSTYGIETVPPLMPFPVRGHASGWRRAAVLVLGGLLALLLAALYRLTPSLAAILARLLHYHGFTAVARAEVVAIAGGGYLYSSRRRVNLSFIHALAQVAISSIMGKPIVMMPQSVGPLPKVTDRRLLRWAFRAIDPVVVRDDESVVLVEQVLPEKTVRLVPDVVFAGLPPAPGNESASSPLAGSIHRVLIVVMDWTWARSVGPNILDEYITKIAWVADRLIRDGHEVVLGGNSRMPEQDQDDFAVAARIMALMTPADTDRVTLLRDDLSFADWRAELASADLVIGTRLHSCIVAMVEGTPAIALAYQPKTQGTYALLHLSELCMDVERFDRNSLNQLASVVLSELAHYRDQVKGAVANARRQIVEQYETRSPVGTPSRLGDEGQPE